MGSVVRAEFGGQPQSQRNNRSCVKVNKQGGFVASWRSMGDASWAEDVYLLAAFHRMLWMAQSSDQTVDYNGQNWSLKRGQLVIIPERFGRKLKDRQGRPMPRMAVRRLLEWFERDGMILCAGTDKGTVVTIVNYDAYQSLMTVNSRDHLTDQPTDHHPDHLKATPRMGLSWYADQPTDHLTDHATVPEEQPCKEQPEIDRDLNNPFGSEFAEATSTPASGNDLPAEPVSIPDEAAIHAVSGKTLLWGTPEDLLCAEHIAKDRKVAFERRGLQAPKDPSMARWANDVRLMRERDGRGHRDICELFRFVCQHGRELEFCQSPDKLRSQWDALQLKRSNAQAGVTGRARPLSNLAAAQQAAREMQAQGRGVYDDNTPL